MEYFYKTNRIKRQIKKTQYFLSQYKIKEPIFSYVKTRGNKIFKIIEKKKISNKANTGAYYFNSIKKFNSQAKLGLKKNKKIYVSDIYNLLLKKMR